MQNRFEGLDTGDKERESSIPETIQKCVLEIAEHEKGKKKEKLKQRTKELLKKGKERDTVNNDTEMDNTKYVEISKAIRKK